MGGDEVRVVFITAGNQDEAVSIARRLVDERLAACVNLIRDVRSIYRWQGELCDSSEVLLMIKTRQSLMDRLMALVLELHSYSTPEIVALPVSKGLPAYLDWVIEATGAPAEAAE